MTCYICHAAPATRGVVCASCAAFSCDEHGRWLPIACGNKIVCESCHERDGCPQGDADGCCIECGATVDCQRGGRDGLCELHAMAQVGGGA